jgi:hypothetical protein
MSPISARSRLAELVRESGVEETDAEDDESVEAASL